MTTELLQIIKEAENIIKHKDQGSELIKIVNDDLKAMDTILHDNLNNTQNQIL